jgi:hypothetical protein
MILSPMCLTYCEEPLMRVHDIVCLISLSHLCFTSGSLLGCFPRVSNMDDVESVENNSKDQSRLPSLAEML